MTLTASPAGSTLPMGYRQGKIITWNPVTLENTVRIGGEGGPIFTDLPVLGVAEAASLHPGSVVGIMVVGSSWAIIGRMVIPGTADAEDAITQVGQRAFTASVTDIGGITSTTFGDPSGTIGPAVADVLIPASGKVAVTITALIEPSGAGTGAVGVEITGATSIAAEVPKSLFNGNPDAIAASSTVLFEGLPAGGRCTFTLKYRGDGVNQANFADRTIIVQAL